MKSVLLLASGSSLCLTKPLSGYHSNSLHLQQRALLLQPPQEGAICFKGATGQGATPAWPLCVHASGQRPRRRTALTQLMVRVSGEGFSVIKVMNTARGSLWFVRVGDEFFQLPSRKTTSDCFFAFFFKKNLMIFSQCFVVDAQRYLTYFLVCWGRPIVFFMVNCKLIAQHIISSTLSCSMCPTAVQKHSNS